MFDTEEQEKVQQFLRCLPQVKSNYWFEEERPKPRVYDFRDLMAGDEYLNQLTLSHNGSIYTSFDFNGLVSFFGLEGNEIIEYKQYGTRRVDFTIEDEERLGIPRRRITLTTINGERKRIPFETYFLFISEKYRWYRKHRSFFDVPLDMKAVPVSVGICGACLPLTKDGYMGDLFKRVISENRSLIIDHAVPEDDGNAERTGLIYIVHGIGNRSL